MMLANSTSSSFSRQSAIVLYILSGLRFTHSCLIMRLPLVSRRRRSVQNSLSRLTMKKVKYESSLFLDICDKSCKSLMTTVSDGSESVFNSAGNVPSCAASA